jgi:hypothetical protein
MWPSLRRVTPRPQGEAVAAFVGISRKGIVSRDGSGDSQRRPSADRNSPAGGSLIRTDGLEGAVLGGGRTQRAIADVKCSAVKLDVSGDGGATLLALTIAPPELSCTNPDRRARPQPQPLQRASHPLQRLYSGLLPSLRDSIDVAFSRNDWGCGVGGRPALRRDPQ